MWKVSTNPSSRRVRGGRARGYTSVRNTCRRGAPALERYFKDVRCVEIGPDISLITPDNPVSFENPFTYCKTFLGRELSRNITLILLNKKFENSLVLIRTNDFFKKNLKENRGIQLFPNLFTMNPNL